MLSTFINAFPYTIEVMTKYTAQSPVYYQYQSTLDNTTDLIDKDADESSEEVQHHPQSQTSMQSSTFDLSISYS
jgi:hypothetical protein